MGLCVEVVARVNLKPLFMGLYVEVVAGVNRKPVVMGLYVDAIVWLGLQRTSAATS